MSRSIIQLKNDPINRLTIYIIRVIESLQDKESNRQKLAFHPPLLLSSTSTLEAALSSVIRARISLFWAAVFRPTRPRHHQIHSITRAYSINYFHFASMAFPFQWSPSPSPPRVDAVSTAGIPFQWNSPLNYVLYCEWNITAAYLSGGGVLFPFNYVFSFSSSISSFVLLTFSPFSFVSVFKSNFVKKFLFIISIEYE